jgi:hypothetical protein
MPPGRLSRYRFNTAFRDADERLFLDRREPFPYVELADNRRYVAAGGETLRSVAAVMFRRIVDRPNGLWWVIADFQSEPIHDPTLVLEPAQFLWVPSEDTVLTRIFNERRRTG